MKQIIIPTDFSDISRNSIIYGFRLAEKLNFRVHLVHVLELYKFAAGTSEAELISTILPADNIQEMEESAKVSFKKMLDEMAKDIPAQVSYEMQVISGHLVNEMVVQSATDNTELMILAVAGSQDLISRFTHNTISAIISDAACPILVVPSGFTYRDPSKVVLATDFNKSDLNLLDSFLSLYKLFSPTIKVIHITQKQSDFKTELKFAGFKQLAIERAHYDSIDFSLQMNKNVVQGILDFLKVENADMLLMLKEHEGFFKSLFETSKTEKIAHYLKIPMISFHETPNTKKNNSK